MAKLILGPSGSGKSTLINKRFIGFKNLIFGYEQEKCNNSNTPNQ